MVLNTVVSVIVNVSEIVRNTLIIKRNIDYTSLLYQKYVFTANSNWLINMFLKALMLQTNQTSRFTFPNTSRVAQKPTQT